VTDPTERAAPRFLPAKPRRAFDEIISQIRDLIHRGDLEPGDRLPPERQLADQFGVSRNTVREALRMLEITGMLDLKKGASGGAFIARGDVDAVAKSVSQMLQFTNFSLTDITEARMWIEPTIVRVVCERASGEDLDALTANVDEAERLTQLGDWNGKMLVHLEFNKLLARATQNPLMIIVSDSMHDIVRSVVSAVGPTRSEFMVQARRRLLSHLRARDADAAEGEMRDYLTHLHRIWFSGSQLVGGKRAYRSATIGGTTS
jgi:DNA-binding FadR family transcriptional regulator